MKEIKEGLHRMERRLNEVNYRAYNVERKLHKIEENKNKELILAVGVATMTSFMFSNAKIFELLTAYYPGNGLAALFDLSISVILLSVLSFTIIKLIFLVFGKITSSMTQFIDLPRT